MGSTGDTPVSGGLHSGGTCHGRCIGNYDKRKRVDGLNKTCDYCTMELWRDHHQRTPCRCLLGDVGIGQANRALVTLKSVKASSSFCLMRMSLRHS